ncbi:MAG: 50S ribosomal protein L25 [Nitrospirota bacterium]|nr:50S ribosomal protein L25 [Nitrospirota bacterium]
MEHSRLKVSVRENTGKGVARTLRRSGNIPAVVYGAGKSTSLSASLKDVEKSLHTHAGRNGLFDLEIVDGQSVRTALTLVRGIQRDPITGKILHLDFFEVSEKAKVRNRVPLEVVGSVPSGVKAGGVLDFVVRVLHVECLSFQMPDHIQVDASNLDINQTFHVRDLALPPGVTVLEEPDAVLIHVIPPKAES